MSRFFLITLWGLFIAIFSINICPLYSDQTIIVQMATHPPVIDGKGTDAVWAETQEIVTKDKIADIDITLKALYTKEEIFFLVSFPDPEESRNHKSWVWDEKIGIYKVGGDIEDVFVFKWSMESEAVDLTLKSDRGHKADIWFWKACRTDPTGYADDKLHILSSVKADRSTELQSNSGKPIYLTRKGDNGKSAYKTDIVTDYKGDKIAKYKNRKPAGSRADVRAKGLWENGVWTIEFARALITGNDDDVPFDTSMTYRFGVSKNEIAGRDINPKLDQPLYGSGDLSEILTMEFVR